MRQKGRGIPEEVAREKLAVAHDFWGHRRIIDSRWRNADCQFAANIQTIQKSRR